ncbi:efflux RND transporter periplasmic adaptor subunit [Halomonas vilamensis]|uniref:Efflux RND transporter periplasmic adaptor subunit n=1 Tax=Vreelandella vilamensis TaxID=531309 RepID=A0ABU1GZR3_9GAMM|nr:efflux RND transporter periplasmic adaptor subunit [Halomonas vilamensis]MDR5897541.1 efflux RND transporter periplasmic adaptor subunit [Halomonas vilamensis]
MIDSRFRFSRQTGRFHLGALAALLVLVGGATLAWWLLNQPPRIERRPPPEPTPPLVEVIHTQRVEQAPTLEAFGRVEAEQQANIASRVAGELTHFGQDVVPGGVVEQGATLATIDQADLRLALEDAEAELANAQAQLALEQGEQQRARSEYQSFGRELSPERRALVLREPQLRQAQAGVTQARVARDQAALNLERATLTTPWRAMVRERLAGAGSLLSQGSEVIHLVGVEQFWVRASLPGEWLGWLAVGDRVTLTSRGWPTGEQREGELVSILPNLEENGLQAQVLIAVEDPLALESSGPALRLGDIVRAILHPKPREALIALPSSALRPGDVVWTLDDDDQLRQTTVTLAYRGETQALVRTGLDADTRVVVAGLAQPSDGQRVRVREAAQ